MTISVELTFIGDDNRLFTRVFPTPYVRHEPAIERAKLDAMMLGLHPLPGNRYLKIIRAAR